jgi:hypothetical protein
LAWLFCWLLLSAHGTPLVAAAALRLPQQRLVVL